MEAGETPAAVYEMKKQVESFQEKLEVLNGFKDGLHVGGKYVGRVNMIQGF